MRDPKLTFLIRCAYGAVWLALIWLMVRYVLVWLLPFLIALALAALLEPAVVLCRRRLHLRRGFTATVLSLVVLGTVAAGLVLLAMVLLRQVCELSGRLPGYLEALPRWTELVRGRAQQLCAACPEGLRSWLEALLDGLSAQLAELLESIGQRCLRAVTAAAAARLRHCSGWTVGFCAFGVAGMVLCPMALLFVKQLHDSGWLRLWK